MTQLDLLDNLPPSERFLRGWQQLQAIDGEADEQVINIYAGFPAALNRMTAVQEVFES